MVYLIFQGNPFFNDIFYGGIGNYFRTTDAMIPAVIYSCLVQQNLSILRRDGLASYFREMFLNQIRKFLTWDPLEFIP